MYGPSFSWWNNSERPWFVLQEPFMTCCDNAKWFYRWWVKLSPLQEVCKKIVPSSPGFLFYTRRYATAGRHNAPRISESFNIISSILIFICYSLIHSNCPQFSTDLFLTFLFHFLFPHSKCLYPVSFKPLVFRSLRAFSFSSVFVHPTSFSLQLVQLQNNQT